MIQPTLLECYGPAMPIWYFKQVKADQEMLADVRRFATSVNWTALDQIKLD